MEKKEYDSEDFVSALHSESLTTPCTVKGVLHIDYITDMERHLISDVEFLDDVYIGNSDRSTNTIYFKDCKFNSLLYIDGLKHFSFFSLLNCAVKDFQIYNSNINQFRIDNKVIKLHINSFLIYGSNFDHFSINNVESQNLEVSSDFNKFELTDLQSNTFTIANSKITELDIRSILTNEFNIRNISSNKTAKIDNIISENIEVKTVDSGYFKIALSIANKIENLTIGDSSFALLNVSSRPSIEFNLFTFGNNVITDSCVFFFPKCKFTSLFLIFNDRNDGDIIMRFYKSYVNSMTLNGEIGNGTVSIFSILFNSISLVNFTNLSKLKLIDITGYEIDSKLEFINSQLGSTYLSGSDLSKCQVEYNGSIIRDLIYSNITWFENKNVNVKSITSLNSETIEFFRQMKIAASNNSDKVKELEFKAYEYEWHRKNHKKRPLKWYDRLSFWISRNTNFYGLDWVRPLVQIILINYFLFFFLGWKSESKDEFIYLSHSMDMSIFVEFFNPTHKQIFDVNQPVLYVIESISRLINGFYIYQIIRAFRKYF